MFEGPTVNLGEVSSRPFNLVKRRTFRIRVIVVYDLAWGHGNISSLSHDREQGSGSHGVLLVSVLPYDLDNGQSPNSHRIHHWENALRAYKSLTVSRVIAA